MSRRYISLTFFFFILALSQQVDAFEVQNGIFISQSIVLEHDMEKYKPIYVYEDTLFSRKGTILSLTAGEKREFGLMNGTKRKLIFLDKGVKVKVHSGSYFLSELLLDHSHKSRLKNTFRLMNDTGEEKTLLFITYLLNKKVHVKIIIKPHEQLEIPYKKCSLINKIGLLNGKKKVITRFKELMIRITASGMEMSYRKKVKA